jgi:hypothetical protein
MVTFLWIVFDAAITVRMMITGYPWWEIVLWGLAGLILGGYAWYAEDRGNRAHASQLAEIEKNQTFQSGRLSAITDLLSPEIGTKLVEALSVNQTQAPELVAQAVASELGATFEEFRSQNEQVNRNFEELKSLIAKSEPAEQRLQEVRQRIEGWQSTLWTPQALGNAQQQTRNQAMVRRRMHILAAAGAWVDAQKQLKKDDPKNGQN